MMHVVSGDVMRYHEERVEELARQYQDSKWLDAQLSDRMHAAMRSIRSWFDRDVETVSAPSGRLETKPVRVEN